MRIDAQFRSNTKKVGVITVVFILVNWFMTFYNDAYIYSYMSQGPAEIYDIHLNYVFNTITGVFAGLLGGTALVFVNARYFRKKSYGYALKATFIAYTTVYVIVTITMSFLSGIIYLGIDKSFAELHDYAGIFMYSKMALVFYIFWGLVTLLTLFFLQISDKFGPGMLSKFLVGKYHEPREEQRIFMFMDMKSSTTIAEQIGNKMYFNLLNELFNDITDAVLSSDGEIYQYVGDEVVISWSLDRGVRKANCITCFEKVRNTLMLLGPYYEQKYGVRPTFKAGLHYGMVTAGEIGSIKKDIVYSGDVLNTTSRIQEQCNNYDVDFLVSKDTLDILGDGLTYEPVHIGNIELRGKKTRIDINTLKKTVVNEGVENQGSIIN